MADGKAHTYFAAAAGVGMTAYETFTSLSPSLQPRPTLTSFCFITQAQYSHHRQHFHSMQKSF